MAATPKPVRKVAKIIKREHKQARKQAYTTYGKEKGKVEIKKAKSKPLSELKLPAEFRIKHNIKGPKLNKSK